MSQIKVESGKKTVAPASKIRQTIYEAFPVKWLQWLITLITGCPYQGQKPLFRQGAWWRLIIFTGMLYGGVALSVLAIYGYIYPLFILLGWVITVGGGRGLQTSISHFAVHSKFTGNKKVDMMIAEIISVVLFIMNAPAYFKLHCIDHHSPSIVATKKDGDVEFIVLLGFNTGMTVQELREHFWKVIFSPKFHWIFFKARAVSNFVKANTKRIIAAAAYWLLVLGLVVVSGNLITFSLVWVVPVIFLYQISALCQFLTEHYWLIGSENSTVDHLTKQEQKERAKMITPTRFFGDILLPGASGWQKAVWLLRLFFIHLPLRIFVVPSSCLVWHSHHHAEYKVDWPNETFGGYAWAKENPGQFTEVWGLHAAFTLVFETLSELPSVEAPVDEAGESYLGM